ncbi:Receptor protein kinase [Quillaja saponaria]|uniref:Receptor-like serine/threonine-protein kinase n=1 Tax=Quillaja saponaria TaxID=32244 RepID=A0AAD7LHC1_QUISA|nr:Receptor protein kinase [Quillaja saponaria]
MEFTCMSIIIVLLSLALSFGFSSSEVITLRKGSSLSVEKPEHDFLVSSNRNFSAGFYAVGNNAYSFAVWFNPNNGQTSRERTVVWMANRDNPVNGKRSKLFLFKTGNLILTDAGKFTVWATNTDSLSNPQLLLQDTGNLVLRNSEGVVLWQSFDFPTDTLLPQQHLTRITKLISSRTRNNHSSGFYQLFFDDDNLLKLLYNGPDVSSVYWPDPWLVSWEAGRSTFNNSRVAVLDSLGNLTSSDDFSSMAYDYGRVIQRRLKLDYDGNIRLYSRENGGEEWVVSWQAKSQPCRVHGICGANSTCNYDPSSVTGRKCYCLPGYRLKNQTDWSYGCEPNFEMTCNRSETGFLKLRHVEFYGYDYNFLKNITLEKCKNECLQLCNCKAFQYTFRSDEGFSYCYYKTLLLNGYRSPSYEGDTYIKLPKIILSSIKKSVEETNSACAKGVTIVLERAYTKGNGNSLVTSLLWFVSAIGGFEIACILLVWFFLFRTQPKSVKDPEGYHLTATGFRKFSYSELKEATQRFSQEIGRGGGGIVYKGVLLDKRVAAIKRLDEANQGEGEFLAEVSIIGRLNHMNLIEMWGYCVEGKHRLLVYEYMENGSLSENLLRNSLNWVQRLKIALGTAKGLAYLHEECLEWILHCDIKPQNILLDSNHQPKVADFGLSKLLNRNDLNNSSISRIRGTRGYMAPEWIFNSPITSKVDVYSFGIVVLEILTGKSPTTVIQTIDDGVEVQNRRLVTWVRETKSRGTAEASWVKQIIDPVMEGNYDVGKMETLAGVALQCVEEEKDARPTMRQVVEMLQNHEIDY